MKYLASLLLLCAAFYCRMMFAPTIADNDSLYENGSVDDREARIRFEFERLRDPKLNAIPPGIREREEAFVVSLQARANRGNMFSKEVDSSETALSLDSSLLMQHGIERTGGRTRAIAIDVSDENVLLIASAGGGVWRSSDAGQTWKRTTSDNTVPSATCLTQDPRPGKTKIWYYGSGEIFSSGGYPTYQYDIGSGAYKSTNGGKSWQRLASSSTIQTALPDSPFHFINSMAVDPVRMDSDIVYAACNGCIMRSNNGGDSWQRVLGSQGDYKTPNWSDVTISSTGVAYASIGAAGYTGIWRSENGIQWTDISVSTNFGVLSGRARIVSAPSNPKVIWVFKSNDANNSLWKYTYQSGGGTWENRGSVTRSKLPTQNGYNMALNVHPTDENIVLVGGTSLYYTTDGFISASKLNHVGGYSKQYLATRSWNPIFPEHYLYERSHPDIHTALFMPSDPKKVLLACDGGVFKTNNIGDTLVQWSSLNSTYNATQFYSVAIDAVGNRDGVIIGGAQDNNSSVGLRDGRTMKWVLGGDGMICEVDHGHRNFYPSYQGGQVYRVAMNSALDSVTQWVNVKPRGSSFDFVCPMKLDPVNDSILYMIGGRTLWRNSDVRGIPFTNDTSSSLTNWKSTSLFTQVGSASLSAVEVCSSPANRIYLGTNTGMVLRVSGVNLSSPIVKVVTGPTMPRNAYVNSITVDPSNGESVFVVFSNYGVLSVFHSSDGGGTWDCISGNLEEFPDGSGAGPACNSIGFLTIGKQTLYILGTTSGVFTTTSLNGVNTSWTKFLAIPSVNVEMIKTRMRDGFVAIATHGLGIYTTYIRPAPLDTVSSAVSFDSQTNKECWVQCLPNPLLSQGLVRFYTKMPCEVDIEMYDERGQLLKTLYHSSRSDGAHELPLDLSGFSAGRYYLRLKTDNVRLNASAVVIHY